MSLLGLIKIQSPLNSIFFISCEQVSAASSDKGAFDKSPFKHLAQWDQPGRSPHPWKVGGKVTGTLDEKGRLRNVQEAGSLHSRLTVTTARRGG